MEPTLEDLPKYEQEFKVRDETSIVLNAKWEWVPTIPTGNVNGVTGWALSDGQVIRLRVWAHAQCSARHPASRYGHFPVPRHVRLIRPCETGPVHSQVPSKPVHSQVPSGGLRGCIVW